MLFKRQLPHLSVLDSVCAPSTCWWQSQPVPSCIFTLQTFWHPASVTSWISEWWKGSPQRSISDPWHQSCWHSTHPGCCLLLAQVCDSEGEQPAPCWLQESLHQQTYQLLYIFFFHTSSSYPRPCLVALTDITITMWVLWVWSCLREGFVGSMLQWWCWKAGRSGAK